MSILVIDDGSSNIKAAFNGKFIIFPSTVERSLRNTTGGKVSPSTYEDKEGNKFSINEHSVEPIRTSHIEYQSSKACAALVCEAIRRLGIRDQDIYIYCTLPVSLFYNSDGTKNSSIIEQKKENLLELLKPCNEEVFIPEVKEVKVFPEAIAAACYLAPDNAGLVTVIDVGGYSIDLTQINLLTMEALSFHSIFGKGMNFVEDKIKDFIVKYTTMKNKNYNIPESLVKKSLTTGKFSGVGISPVVEEALTEIKEAVLRAINDSFPLPEAVDSIILCGGGSNVYLPLIQEWAGEPNLDKILTPSIEESILANVKGIFQAL